MRLYFVRFRHFSPSTDTGFSVIERNRIQNYTSAQNKIYIEWIYGTRTGRTGMIVGTPECYDSRRVVQVSRPANKEEQGAHTIHIGWRTGVLGKLYLSSSGWLAG